MAADASAEQKVHLQSCAVCAAEVKRHEIFIAQARAGICAWSQSLQSSDAAFMKRLGARQRRAAAVRVLQVSVAMVLLLLVPGTVVQQRSEHARHQADDLLLRTVDAEISETVPDAMQPLNKLVAWPEGGSQQGQSRTEETK